MMKEQFFEIFLTKGKFRNIFLVDIEKDIFRRKGLFSKERDWKRQEKDQTKREEQLEGFTERDEKENEKATENKRNNIEKKKEDDL